MRVPARYPVRICGVGVYGDRRSRQAIVPPRKLSLTLLLSLQVLRPIDFSCRQDFCSKLMNARFDEVDRRSYGCLGSELWDTGCSCRFTTHSIILNQIARACHYGYLDLNRSHTVHSPSRLEVPVDQGPSLGALPVLCSHCAVTANIS